MSACHQHPTGERYQRQDGYSECVPCRREWRREARARDARPPQRSTPNKLAGRLPVLYAAVDLGLWTRREVAEAYGISETRLYQLLRERREVTP